MSLDKLLLLIIAFNSCNTTPNIKTRDKAIQFSRSFTEILGHCDVQNKNFTDYFKIIGKTVIESGNIQVDSSRVDSLNNYYQSLSSCLSQTIKQLNDLGEFDTSFKIIFHTVNQFDAIKKAYDSTIPTYIKVYRQGWLQTDIYEQVSFKYCTTQLNRGQDTAIREQKLMGVELNKFAIKYNIEKEMRE